MPKLVLQPKIIRTKLGFTQSEVSELAGISQGALSLLENGKPPSRKECGKLCAFYGLSKDIVFPFKEYPLMDRM